MKISEEEKVAEREAKKQVTVHTENGTTYTNFKKICEARGLTSSAAINMLISDFVLENKQILEQ